MGAAKAQRGLLSWQMRAILIGVLFVSVGAGGVAFLGMKSDVERAEGWVSLTGVPAISTLEELAAYPQAYRMTIYSRLDPSTKSRLWREQIRRYLAETPNLTTRQRAYLQDVMAKATPDAVASTEKTNLCQDLKGLFPDLKVIRIARASNIGAFATPDYSVMSRLVQWQEQLVEEMVVHAQETYPTCDCYNVGWCECSGLSECCYNTNEMWVCNPSGTGQNCGCWWEEKHSCNGYCRLTAGCPTMGG